MTPACWRNQESHSSPAQHVELQLQTRVPTALRKKFCRNARSQCLSLCQKSPPISKWATRWALCRVGTSAPEGKLKLLQLLRSLRACPPSHDWDPGHCRVPHLNAHFTGHCLGEGGGGMRICLRWTSVSEIFFGCEWVCQLACWCICAWVHASLTLVYMLMHL